MRAVIIDGYVDEPAVLGVPPYVSPYIRYAAGALMYHGIEVDYFTIDQVRELDLFQSLDKYDYLVIIAGTTVPGHYLGGTPIHVNEIKKIFSLNRSPLRVIGGPINRGFTITGGTNALSLKDYLKDEVDYVVSGDIEKFLYEYPVSDNFDLAAKSDYELTDRLSVIGAEIIKKHPRFPDIMLEIDVSKGCDRREGFCSFCTEPLLHGLYRERSVKGILEEMSALNKAGGVNFRFGRSANFLAYGITFNGYKANPSIFEELYSEISRYAKIIHTDNANPDFIIKNETEVRKILETIARYNSSGDTLSFGAESFDKEVVLKNRIGVMPDDVIKAVRIVNEIGGIRDANGVPKLLPGINLLYGLIGETKETYQINKKYLDQIYDEGLMLRRINVRQVMIFDNTYISTVMKEPKIPKKEFLNFKEYMEEYNHKMIKRVFPIGTVLKDIIIEESKGTLKFGRQIGTYPVLVGISKNLNKLEKVDGIVVDHGARSLTAVTKPFILEKADIAELSSISGISKKTAENIKLNYDGNIENLSIEEEKKKILKILAKEV